jgi:hypothetical protein
LSHNRAWHRVIDTHHVGLLDRAQQFLRGRVDEF